MTAPIGQRQPTTSGRITTSVSILVGKLKIVLYLYELTENLYGSAYSLYAGDAGSVVPLFASGVGVDVDTDLLHHDEEGARVQACGEVP